MTEGFVSENSRRHGGQYDRVIPFLHGYGTSHKLFLLLKGSRRLGGFCLQLFKIGIPFLPHGAEFLFSLHHLADKHYSAGLVIIVDIGAQRGFLNSWQCNLPELPREQAPL